MYAFLNGHRKPANHLTNSPQFPRHGRHCCVCRSVVRRHLVSLVPMYLSAWFRCRIMSAEARSASWLGLRQLGPEVRSYGAGITTSRSSSINIMIHHHRHPSSSSLNQTNRHRHHLMQEVSTLCDGMCKHIAFTSIPNKYRACRIPRGRCRLAYASPRD